MIFSIKGLMVLVMALILFGGAIYDITTAGARCGLSVTVPQNNYTCDDLWWTLGKTFIMPDQNIGKGTEGILILKSLDNETIERIGVMKEAQLASYRGQIIIGVVGLFVLFLILSYVLYKTTPSSLIDASAKLFPFVVALLVMSLMMVMFDNSAEPGFLGIEGAHMPFKGVRTLLANPIVLSDVVDDTAILPGTLTTDDIVEGES